MMRLLLSCVVVLVLLVNVGCTDAQLTNLAKALNDTALAMGTLQTTVIQANRQGALSDQTTTDILTLCFRINAAGQQASQATRALTKLSVADKTKVLAILQPIILAVASAAGSNEILSISGPAKPNIQAAFVALQAALTTAQTILSVTGGK